jgi:hypothetical protein
MRQRLTERSEQALVSETAAAHHGAVSETSASYNSIADRLFSRTDAPARPTAVAQRRASVAGGSPSRQQQRPGLNEDHVPPRRPTSGPSPSSSSSSSYQHQQPQSQFAMPASLGSARDDLQDVISALGVSPLHLGLGLNPRNSSVSEAYTHNASGRGSTMDRENLASPGDASTHSSATGAEHEVSSVEKRLKALVNTALQSPVRVRRL